MFLTSLMVASVGLTHPVYSEVLVRCPAVALEVPGGIDFLAGKRKERASRQRAMMTAREEVEQLNSRYRKRWDALQVRVNGLADLPTEAERTRAAIALLPELQASAEERKEVERAFRAFQERFPLAQK